MTVTKFPSTPTPIAAALHAAFVGVAFASGAGGVAPSAHAGEGSGEESNKRSFRIPAGPLGPALSRFATRAGARLSFDPALTEGKTTRGLSGDFTREEGLAALLAGTGLEWAPGPGGTYTVRPTARAQATPEAPVPTDEQPAPLDTILLDPITVTGQPLDQGFKADTQESATKTPLSIRETPQSISVITQDSLEARQVQDLGQALETAAGVNVFSGTDPFGGVSPFGFDQTQIRGVSLNGARDIREDGFVSSTFFFPTDLAIYERIDVVKGPSSTLYGRGSAGGFVNRIRKKPLPKFSGEIAPSIGSFDSYRLDADATGPLSESKKVRGRLVAAYENAGSFIDGVESERALLAPSLEVDLTVSTRVLLQGTYQKDEFIPNTGFPLVLDAGRFRAPDVRRPLFFGVPNEDENKWEFLTGNAQIEQELGDNWLATLRLNGSSQDTPIDQDNYVYGIGIGGDVYLYSSAFDIQRDVWSGELQLQGNLTVLGRPANVALGVERSDLDYHRSDAFIALGTANIYDENFADFPTAEPALSRDTRTDTRDTGVYGQVQFRPLERLSVLLGGRYDVSESSYVDTLLSISEQEDKDFTGRAGLTFDVNDQISVYGLYAQSFEPTSSVTRGGDILAPETGEIWEAGIKTGWLNGKLGINAALFRIERDDVAIPDPSNGPGESFSVSGGLQRSDGIELEINGEPSPGWNLSFAGTLLDSEFKERDDPFFGSTPGGAADWQAGLFTSYELQGGPLQGLGAGVGLFAIDDRGVSTFIPGATLDGYERVDLSAFYNGFRSFKIALQVRNVFDEVYVAGADRTAAQAQFGSPTAVLLTVRYDFE